MLKNNHVLVARWCQLSGPIQINDVRRSQLNLFFGVHQLLRKISGLILILLHVPQLVTNVVGLLYGVRHVVYIRFNKAFPLNPSV